jgi:hypothetical protein
LIEPIGWVNLLLLPDRAFVQKPQQDLTPNFSFGLFGLYHRQCNGLQDQLTRFKQQHHPNQAGSGAIVELQFADTVIEVKALAREFPRWIKPMEGHQHIQQQRIFCHIPQLVSALLQLGNELIGPFLCNPFGLVTLPFATATTLLTEIPAPDKVFLLLGRKFVDKSRHCRTLSHIVFEALRTRREDETGHLD